MSAQKLLHTPGQIATYHTLVRGDARDMVEVDDDSVGLVATSPPYWTLKKYPAAPKVGNPMHYDAFIQRLCQEYAIRHP